MPRSPQLPSSSPSGSPSPAGSVTAYGPASLSNLGPGFDALGLCLEGLYDVVTARRTAEPGGTVTVDLDGPFIEIPTEPASNTAAVAAEALLRAAGASFGVNLHIRKGIVPGSGLGSSAASAVAGAWAASRLLDAPPARPLLVEAVLQGEAVASGSIHGDNVLPALFGGLVLTSPTDARDYRRIPLPGPMPVALVQPRVRILTRAARAMLPEAVPLREAVCNAADLAFMLDALRAGDWETVGRQVMRDRLVEPVRATLLPCYDAVRDAAREAGALGCALSGSGPAMFAVTATPEAAERVAEAMVQACRDTGVEATSRATQSSSHGVSDAPAGTARRPEGAQREAA